MALVGALCISLNNVIGSPTEPSCPKWPPAWRRLHRNQISFELGRLRLNGLIERVDGSNTYLLAPDGSRALRSSTSRFTSDCSDRCSPQTHHPHRPNDATPRPASIDTSGATTPTSASETVPKNSRSTSTSGDQRIAEHPPDPATVWRQSRIATSRWLPRSVPSRCEAVSGRPSQPSPCGRPRPQPDCQAT